MFAWKKSHHLSRQVEGSKRVIIREEGSLLEYKVYLSQTGKERDTTYYLQKKRYVAHLLEGGEHNRSFTDAR